MIPQSYPLWIQTEESDQIRLVVGWIADEEEDDLKPVCAPTDTWGGTLSVYGAFRVISPTVLT